MIAIPSFKDIFNALCAEFWEIDFDLCENFIKSIKFDKNGNQITTGFSIYVFEMEDLGEVVYMCVKWKYSNDTFVFGKQIESGGFDSLEESVEYLKSLHKVKEMK